MLLRDHPLMSYRGPRSWPPVWTWVDGRENKPPQGEIGILTSVVPSMVLPANRCFLYIDYEESSYIGCLLFDDRNFCCQVVTLLQNHLDKPISEIGKLDVSHIL